jgi:tyrosyl-tRNA synthetase
VLINKEKANDQMMINTGYLLNKRYVLVQKGKKNYFLVIAG